MTSYRQYQIQKVVAFHRQHLNRAQGAADLHAHLLGAGIAQRIQQIAVVEADLHLVALAGGAELVHHAAEVRLAAHHDFTLCKGDAKGIF